MCSRFSRFGIVLSYSFLMKISGELLKRLQLSIQLLSMAPVLFIPVIIFVLFNLIIETEEDTHRQAIQQLEQDYIESEKSRIRAKVNNLVDLSHYNKSIIDDSLLNRVRGRVNDAQQVAIGIYEENKGKLSEKEIKKQIVEALRGLSWNGGESYIWIVDFEGYLRLGPEYLKAMESKSIIDFKDLSGRKVIQEEIKLTQDGGEGFLWDTFTKPGAPNGKQFKQLAFVKGLGVYDWYLGSAEFLDTATKISNSILLETINQLGKGGSDYVFVIDSKGDLLLNYARPDIVGRNMSETKDSDLHKLFNLLVKAAKTPAEEFVSYRWLNPKTGFIDDKLTYVKNVPNSTWVLGSGFYPSVLERGYEFQKHKLINQHSLKIKYMNRLLWLVSSVAVFVSILLTFFLYRAIARYRNDFNDQNENLKRQNIELEEELIRTKRNLNQGLGVN